MTPNEFKKRYSKELRNLLESDMGRHMTIALGAMRPKFNVQTPHQHTESAGAVRGFENCISSLYFLAQPPVKNEEPEMTYGVDEEAPAPKASKEEAAG